MAAAEGLRWEEFPRRTIHLDFHTSPDIPDVGVGFDADAFARTFSDAHVDSVTVFAKCHHGRLYFDTDRPERHPGLDRGLDLMGQQVEALHGAGIKAPIYVSVQCDEYAADLHQDWVALTPELVQARQPMTDAYHAGWQTLDMSSPYQEFLADQIDEILGRYGPVDGMFLDMCWDQPSSSRWAMAGMKRDGLDPASALDRARYARSVAHRYMERFSNTIAAYLRPGSAMAVWFNSRPKAGLSSEAKYLRHIEVESLPTGGWGYDYLPYVGRLARSFGLPLLGMTGRFHRSWGDMASLKPEAALRYECGQILMHGLTVSVGDLLPPDAVPSAAAYDRIGTVYGHIEECEPFVVGGHHLAEVALVVDAELGDAPGPDVIGAVRVLQQLRQQFDVVPVDAPLGLTRWWSSPPRRPSAPTWPAGSATTWTGAAPWSCRPKRPRPVPRAPSCWSPGLAHHRESALQHDVPGAVALPMAHPSRPRLRAGTRGGLRARAHSGRGSDGADAGGAGLPLFRAGLRPLQRPFLHPAPPAVRPRRRRPERPRHRLRRPPIRRCG